jgi:hypothetical protein
VEPDPHLRARIHQLGVPTHTSERSVWSTA